MAITIDTAESLPAVERGAGRGSEETKALKDAVSALEPKVIRGVVSSTDKDKDEFDALSQRIRYAASRAGLGVTVRRQSTDEEGVVDVYFEGFTPEPNVDVEVDGE